MNLAIGFAILLVGFCAGFLIMTHGLLKSNEYDESPWKLLMWNLIAAIGACMMPGAFLAANYFSLVLKPF